jgi:hypothetical protein
MSPLQFYTSVKLGLSLWEEQVWEDKAVWILRADERKWQKDGQNLCLLILPHNTLKSLQNLN